MKELQKHIKNNTFNRVYLLTGDETYQILQGKKMLKNALIREGDTMNFQEYKEERPNLSEIRATAQTVPFFSDWRLIILDRTKVMKTGKDDLINLMEEVADTTVLVICEEEVDKRSKAYKWIKKKGCIREFLKKNNKESTLIRFTAQLLKRGGKQIREQDARYLVNVTGGDMFQLKNETDKLIAYCADRSAVYREDIDAVISPELENKIFEMVAAIARGDKKTALGCYTDLILLKEAPMRILYMVLRQYRILQIIYDMRSHGCSPDETAQTAGIPKFFLGRYEQQLRGYTADMLEACMDRCLSAETAIKTGQIGDRLGVETMIAALLERDYQD